MRRRSRRGGRTFEGTLAFMAAALLAAVVVPPLVAPDPLPAGASCVTSLVAWGVADLGSAAVQCPLDARELPVSSTIDGVAVSCSGEHLAPWPARVERRADGAWSLAQELPPAPDLASERDVDTGAWTSRTTARAEGDGLVVTTRPALWVRLVIAPLLALVSIAIAFVLVHEQTLGWRPGGTRRPPGRAGMLARVALASILNPCGLGAIALWALDRRLEVGHERVVTQGRSIVGVEAGALVPLGDGRGRVVLVRRPVAGETAPVAEGVLTLAAGEAGVARALIDAASR